MIDVSNKTTTLRMAAAEATVSLSVSAMTALKEGRLPKGDPLPVARVAAVQAVKRTADIIPFCHPLPVEHVSVEFDIHENPEKAEIRITVTVKAIYRTGVEMEALTGASVAALTIVDMMKMLDEAMCIRDVRVLEKRGGKSDHLDVYERPLRAAVLVMSDSIAAGAKSDASGKLICERLTGLGIEVVDYMIVPDEVNIIRSAVLRYTDELHVDMLITTGGTGFSPRDCTPEALRGLLHRDLPGITEAIRSYGQARTPYAMLSRGIAGIRGNSIVLTLPGSRKGVIDALDAVCPGILHSFRMLWMQSSPVHDAHPEPES